MTVDRTTAHLKRGIRVSRAQFERLWNSEQTLAEIGQSLGGITHIAVIRRANKLGLPPRAFDARKAMKPTDEALFRLMWNEGVSVADMADHFGISPTAARMRRIRYDLPLRGFRPQTPVSAVLEALLARHMVEDARNTDRLLHQQNLILQRPMGAEAHL